VGRFAAMMVWTCLPLADLGGNMSYRNKTYVAFASEDIHYYRLMTAWVKNEHIDFNFFNAHDLYVARDTSTVETIRRRLRERLHNAKQVVFVGSSDGKKKADDGRSFLWYEVKTIIEFDLPVVVANHDQDRRIDEDFIPDQFLDNDYYTCSVSFQPSIIKYALDNYASKYAGSGKSGPHYYTEDKYKRLGI
jgi:hypothetical protein